MNENLRNELRDMDSHDQSVRAELAADGSLFEGYHLRMEAIHRANAARLRDIIAAHGWPGESLVGTDGAQAAWRIAQHAIGEPAFMRQCRDLLDLARTRGEAPGWHYAFIDDRIRVFEGRSQRYGTQLRGGPDGPEPYPLENPAMVDAWRKELGLPSLSTSLGQSRANPPPAPRDTAAAETQELAWRRQVGWIA